ncbi:hypothetical protein [Bacillus velezensis]|uniref:hypothetical protein n=1 Tax=Bacillus velezensis TaxID=492670 RepID=UPI0012EAA1B9|nr:hypothetical protein [Bacillus velezensis]
MKIPVVKTDVPLERRAKEKMRMEIEKAIKTGIVILDGGLDLAIIKVEDSNIVNETFIEAKTFSPAKGETEAVEYIGGPIIGSCVSRRSAKSQRTRTFKDIESNAFATD